MQVDPKASFTPRRFGKYLLLDRIGRGGMAEVYRSKTFGTAGFVKECAIKKILATLLDDEQFVSMFVDEAKLTAYLTHPNIVQVLDLGDIDGHLFIAMEYVSGKDLLDVLARSARRGTRLPIEITLYIVTEMLKGLDFAHGAVDALGKPMHIVHRDVSPSNILLSYDGQVKVGDFGIAKSQMQSSHTEVGTQKGKTGYMSPEQVTGSLIDRRSDVFAATVILFEMLTMTRLFKAPNDLDVMLKIRDADIEEDLERVGRISEGLEQIIRRGLKRRPDERFQTAGDLLDALRDYAVENRIKLSAAPLAAYLAELFADKIEAERERRTLDPADDHGFGVVASANQAAYRYRDREGVIHGPMRVGLMEELLASRVPNDIEAIALGAADWKSVAAFAEFADVPRPGPAPQLDDASGMGARATGTDWEDLSLAGINPRARRRLRVRGAPGSESGASGRVETSGALRDPNKQATRESVAIESTDSPIIRGRPTTSGAQSAARAAVVERTGRDRQDAKTPTGVSISLPPAIEREPVPVPAAAPRPELESGQFRRASTSGPQARVGRDSGPAPGLADSGASLRIGAGTAARGDSGRAAAPPWSDARGGRAPDLSESGAQPAIDASDTRPPPAVRTGRTTSNHAITEPTLSQHEAEALRRDDARRAPRPTRQGSFGEASVFRLLHRLHIRKASGRLRLQADGLTKDLYFAAGELRTVDSDDPADDLLALLRESDTISLHEAEAAAARARAEGLSDGEALVALGGVAASRLFQFLQMQLSEKLLSCLFWEEGAWSWWAGAEFVPDPFAIEVSIGDLLLRGVAERAETRYFRRFYRPHRAALLEQRRSGDELRGLSLSSRAMRVVASLAEAPTLPEIVHLFCDRYRWPEGDVYRTVFLLTEQDVVRFAGESDAGLP